MFVGTSKLAKLYRRAFLKSLDGAPILLPTDDTAIRRSLDQWLEAENIRPALIGEFEDLALMRVFGQAGVGILPSSFGGREAFRKAIRTRAHRPCT